MRVLVVSVLSWLAGLAAYLGGLSVLWEQTVGSDLGAVVFWSGFAAAVAVVVAYAPVMFALRQRVSTRSWYVFPLVGSALGVVPALFIAGIWSGGHFLRALVSRESALFLCMFSALRRALGAGFFLAYVRRSI